MESTINICWRHSVPSDKMRTSIDKVTADLGADYGAKATWKGPLAHFQCESGIAKGVTGSIELRPVVIRMVVELPFIIRPFAGKIREGIQARLLEHFGGGPC